MKKKLAEKTILTIFLLAILLLQVFPPQTVYADKINWDNPNKNGENPYKFKLAFAVDSQLIMQVVGCTGVTDIVSKAVVSFERTIALALISKSKKEALRKSCDAAKKAAAGGVATVPNVTLSGVILGTVDCKDIQNSNDANSISATEKLVAQQAAAKRTNECLGGIAKYLAKNQLTAMTKYTINWVTSGFNGDPMYVRNIDSFMGSIDKIVTTQEMNLFKSPNNINAYPYGRDYARLQSYGYQTSNNIDNALRQDLTNYIYSHGNENGPDKLNLNNTRDAAVSATSNAIDTYANDFSTGGWEAWLGLTQKDQNNPLGFTLQASNNAAQQIETKKKNAENELLRNGGVFDQKKCVKRQSQIITDEDKKQQQTTLAEDSTKINDELEFSQVGLEIAQEAEATTSAAYNKNQSAENKQNEKNALKDVSIAKQAVADAQNAVTAAKNNSEGKALETDPCVKWETVTPGSLIKDKIANTLNSDTRQLELTQTINDSLNAIFTVLLNKLGVSGLSSLSSTNTNTIDPNTGGEGSNTPVTDEVDDKGNIVRSTGYNGNFDLTRDFGNTYLHRGRKNLGDWDAKNNVPKLYPNTKPGNTAGDIYYVVTTAGSTKLIDNGYNSWAKGDRSYFDSTKGVWQNWKCGPLNAKKECTDQINPIDNRGIIQIQKDYIVVAKEALKIIPSIMPKVGELDYCIPGPNPSWQANTGDTGAAFTESADSLGSSFKKGSLIRRKSESYTIAQPGEPEYDDYYNIFNDPENRTAPSLWNDIKNSLPWQSVNFLASRGISKGGNAIEKSESALDRTLASIANDMTSFVKKYDVEMNKIYYTPMKTQFLQSEDTPDLKENPIYVPMSTTGLNIVKDISNYNSDLTTATQNYNADVIEANSNIYKLTKIKDQVSIIIAAAQKRRNDRFLQILNEESTMTNGPILTEAEYKEKYKSCLEEEQIVYYDENAIMNDTGGSAVERCIDGIDNDLNGLIDMKDPACNKKPVTDTGARVGVGITCSVDTSIEAVQDSSYPESDPCDVRVTQDSCVNNGMYVTGGLGYTCKWGDASVGGGRNY